MKHPFDLNTAELKLVDLNFEEQLTDEQQSPVGGGTVTTMAVGEEGGGIQCISAPCPGSESGGTPWPPKPIPIDPPPMTTRMGSEEGGGHHYTKASCEAGGGPIYW